MATVGGTLDTSGANPGVTLTLTTGTVSFRASAIPRPT